MDDADRRELERRALEGGLSARDRARLEQDGLRRGGTPLPALPTHRLIRAFDLSGWDAYVAERLDSGRRCFLRLSWEQVSEGERSLRLSRVARVAGLHHPNVEVVLDQGTTDGRAFVETEHVEGDLLDELLPRAPLPLSEVARILRGVLAGLGAIHEAGVVVRVLSPEHVLVGERVVIVNLGDAFPDDRDPEAPVAAGYLRDPRYLSPEACLGRRGDGRTDLYAAGAMAYHLVTGRPPLRGETILETFQRKLTLDPCSPCWLVPDLRPELGAFALKLLAREPDACFASAADALAALDAALGAPPVAETPGDSLRALLRAGPLGWVEAGVVLAGAARELARLHGAGRVHGALSPDSLLVEPGGRVRLAREGAAVPVAGFESAFARGGGPAGDARALGASVAWALAGAPILLEDEPRPLGPTPDLGPRAEALATVLVNAVLGEYGDGGALVADLDRVAASRVVAERGGPATRERRERVRLALRGNRDVT